MGRLVTISFTQLDAGGGVPKFNRDLHDAFPDRERVHYCWWDFPWCDEMSHLPEWEKARTLNNFLVAKRLVTAEDVIVADGFWAAGLEHLPLAVSHSHGIWGHITKDDADAGVQPENPLLHAVQVEFRRRWIEQGKHITAVSEFIAEQMRLQWGFEVDRVIDNGVNTAIYWPHDRSSDLNDLLIVHGVNDRGNVNKGWDHIEHLKRSFPGCHVLSLDEAQILLNSRPYVGDPWTKAETLAVADLVVHPSGFEGNSMFVAETLACGVPIVGYDVGFLWSVRNMEIGCIMPRSARSPAATASGVGHTLDDALPEIGDRCRELAVDRLSIVRFRSAWRSYLKEVEHAT